MPVLDVKVGQLVYIIEDNEIYEGSITYFINQKEVVVSSKSYVNPISKKTYGIDFFFTREKAEKVLAKHFEEQKREELRQLKQRQLEARQRKEKAMHEFNGGSSDICGSCNSHICLCHLDI